MKHIFVASEFEKGSVRVLADHFGVHPLIAIFASTAEPKKIVEHTGKTERKSNGTKIISLSWFASTRIESIRVSPKKHKKKINIKEIAFKTPSFFSFFFPGNFSIF